jgi:SpoIID/LytB domain protein
MTPPGRTGRRRRGFGILLALALMASATVFVAGSSSRAYAAEYYPAPASGVYTIDGRGFGHGRGMSQYGSQGAAQQGLSYSQILAHYYPGTTLRTDIGDPGVRVQLTATESGTVRVDAAAGVTVTVKDEASGASAPVAGGPFRVVTAGSTQKLQRHNGSAWVAFGIGGSGAYAGPIRFTASGGWTVYSARGSATTYRGSVTVVRTGDATSVAVNHVNLQGYLYGVVPRESPASWKPAALQAQAVAARSYALRLKQNAKPHWDLCDTTACQVYGGLSSEDSRTNDAVNRTGSVALYYGDAPAFTEFSSSNGGQTSAGNVPYLAAFPDPYDSGGSNPNHQWTETLTTGYFQSNYPSIGTFRGLRVLTRDGKGEWGGRITSIEVVGNQATVTLGTPRFGLKSSWWRPRSENNPIGSFDAATVVAPGQVRLHGWALDPNTTTPVNVHVYLDGRVVRGVTADIPRSDIGAAYPENGDRHGFDFRVNIAQGVHTLCLYALNQGPGDSHTRFGCRSVDLGAPPVGRIDGISLVAGQLRMTGWTLDPDVPDAVSVHAYLDGAVHSQAPAQGSRPDVGRAYPAAGPLHGFDLTLPLPSGRHTVCLYAIDLGPGSVNPQLGCRTVTVVVDPVGALDRLAGGATAIEVSGWALDGDSADPTNVSVQVDGSPIATFGTDRARSDIAATYPGTGSHHGFARSIPVAPGAHDVCVYAVNVGAGAGDTELGCARVSVGVPPIGRLDGFARVGALQVQLSGWALDKDTTAPISVHVYVNGRVTGRLTADVQRPDIGRAYPASGPAHGFDQVLTLAPGDNQVCVYAINVAGGERNPSLGCRTIKLPESAANPFGRVDGVTVAPGSVTVAGWAVDADVPTSPVGVHVYVDGRASRGVVADGARPDIARAYPHYGPNHGFSGTASVTPGRHTVCAYGLNQGHGTSSPSLGCQTVTVP